MEETDAMGRGFGEALRRLMAKSPHNKKSLAVAAGVNRYSVDLWIAGRNVPNLRNVPQLAAALGTTTPRLVALACKLGGVR